jgi:hypothetical protein
MTTEANMQPIEVLMCAHPIERALLLDVIRQGNAETAHRVVGDRMTGATPTALMACTQCRGRINRLCVICQGHGSIRFVAAPDPMLDPETRTNRGERR